MPRLSKREKQEWDIFISPKTRRKTYNKLCRSCLNDCKQSFRTQVIECCRYKSKRAKYYAGRKAEIYSLRERYYPP